MTEQILHQFRMTRTTFISTLSGLLLTVIFGVGLVLSSSEDVKSLIKRLTSFTPNTEITVENTLTSDTTALSQADLGRYQEIFELQQNGKWWSADLYFNNIENPILMGHVLAQRYLHADYESTKQELANWLKSYSDLPQAKRIHAIAKRKGVRTKKLPRTIRRNLTGYGESYRNTRHASPRIAGSWKAALRYWKAANYQKAYSLFVSLEEHGQTMGNWDRAAFSFWAYRTAEKLGLQDKAAEHLTLAARFPRSFYGAQAVHLQGETLDATLSLRGKESLNDYLAEIERADTRTALRRIDALQKIKQNDLAREELLLHYSRADAKDRVAFAPLAQNLDLPALQLRMGVDMERKGVTSGEALYPLPDWKPEQGYTVDPALIFAVARQESGFNSKARSYAGAQGMMQLMPQTASYIAGKMKAPKNLSLNDPQTNVMLGQQYLSYLANKPYIKGNVVLLTAAYNAGPGNAKRWARQQSKMLDPLHFIETLPFAETRDYVMNVMTNYWMYREIMNDGDPGASMLSDGIWPRTIARRNAVIAEVQADN